MPTIQEQKPQLEALKRELEAGGEMNDTDLSIVLTGAQIDDQGLSWIEVMPTAEKARNGPLYFTVTADDLNALVEYIQTHPDRVPIDYDHAGALASAGEGGSTRAAGWFTGEAKVVQTDERTPTGETQDHTSVWAQVKWTPTAVEEIRGGDFRFISAEWGFANQDPKTGLLTKFVDIVAATLTNRPFFKNLAPVVAHQLDSEQLEQLATLHGSEVADLLRAAQGDDEELFSTAISAALAAGGTPSATDQGTDDDPKENIVADDKPVTDYMKALGLDDTIDPKQRLAVAFRDKDDQIERLTAQVTDLTAAGGEKSKQAEELASRLEELEQKDRARDIDLILVRAVEKGRVLPAEKETLAEVFASDVTGLRKLIATRPGDMFVGEAKGGTADPDRYVDDPDVTQYVKGLDTGGDPVDTEQAKTHLAAMQLLKEDGKDKTYTNDEYVAAYNRAAELVY
jgi:phage I-like protein